MKGWVKIYRKIQDNVLWTDWEPFDKRSAFIDLILLANHKETVVFNGATIRENVPAGSFWTSIRALSERWHWTKGKVANYLRTLESLEMIHAKRTANGTLVNIENYCVYQAQTDTEQDTEQDSERDTEQDSERDSERDTYKNGKNGKNVKNTNARARVRTPEGYGPVKKTGFHNFPERHTDYDALFGGAAK